MKTKSSFCHRRYLIFILWFAMQSIGTGQILPPKLLHCDVIDDTSFTQNLHYCIYKLAEQYEYFYLVYPESGKDLLKIPFDDYPKLYVDFIRGNADSLSFNIQEDTLLAFYNGEYFGLYTFDSFWSVSDDEQKYRWIGQYSLFYDKDGLILILPDSIACSFESMVNTIFQSNRGNKSLYVKKSERGTNINCKKVFFEYEVGGKVHLMKRDESITMSRKRKIQVRKLSRIAYQFCKTYHCAKIRFSHVVCSVEKSA